MAEGVETSQQSETVAALGCDIAQGYLYSRPIEADAVSAVMSAALVSADVRPRPVGRGRSAGELAPA